jgi:lipid-binding SYLF domain-containing protein
MWMLASVLVLTLCTRADDREKDEDRLRECGTVLKEILDTQGTIPQRVLDKAECVLVFPHVQKAALGLGGSYGRGAMTCRQDVGFDGPWGAPIMMKMEGLSLGFQLGAQATDFVLLVMNDRGGNEVLSKKIKLGADVTATAGPEERDTSAESDETLRAEFFSYSRSRGLFAGVSLAGSTVRPDNDADLQVYGQRIRPREISARTTAPPSASELISTLTGKTPKRKT